MFFAFNNCKNFSAVQIFCVSVQLQFFSLPHNKVAEANSLNKSAGNNFSTAQIHFCSRSMNQTVRQQSNLRKSARNQANQSYLFSRQVKRKRRLPQRSAQTNKLFRLLLGLQLFEILSGSQYSEVSRAMKYKATRRLNTL